MLYRVAVRAEPPLFVLLPAVDVADGQAVQLAPGRAGSETRYGAPLDAALAWQAAGAQWVHLVDLDATFGRGSNRERIAGVVDRLDVAVQLSGGIRDDESLSAALATVCARVIIGTAALERPDWVRAAIARHGERVAVGLDVRGARAVGARVDPCGRRLVRRPGPSPDRPARAATRGYPGGSTTFTGFSVTLSGTS